MRASECDDDEDGADDDDEDEDKGNAEDDDEDDDEDELARAAADAGTSGRPAPARNWLLIELSLLFDCCSGDAAAEPGDGGDASFWLEFATACLALAICSFRFCARLFCAESLAPRDALGN